MTDQWRVVVAPSATSDIEAIFEYLAERSPSAAGSELDRITDAIASLSWSPARFALVSEGKLLSGQLRRMPLPRIAFTLL